MNIKYCDALVIGGGLAGLRSAVATSKKGLSTTVLSLVPVKRSHSAAAQGGMQASLGNAKPIMPRSFCSPLIGTSSMGGGMVGRGGASW